ncbi:hypothetical protein GCM10027048_39250 [Hymenobacter coalescens]
MTAKKIIAVVGATGAQGGGLARAIPQDAQSAFAVRAATRNAHSEKPAPCLSSGPGSWRPIAKVGRRRALKGACGAFFVASPQIPKSPAGNCRRGFFSE